MALMWKDGDYVSDGAGGLRAVSGAEELLDRVLWKLTVRRGSFPLLPELGSDLHLLGRAGKKEQAALAEQYVTRALADEEVTVTHVTFVREGEKAHLTVGLEWQGQALTAALTVGGLA